MSTRISWTNHYMPNNIQFGSEFSKPQKLSINDETMTAIKQHGVHRRKGSTDNFFYLGNFNVGERGAE